MLIVRRKNVRRRTCVLWPRLTCERQIYFLPRLKSLFLLPASVVHITWMVVLLLWPHNVINLSSPLERRAAALSNQYWGGDTSKPHQHKVYLIQCSNFEFNADCNLHDASTKNKLVGLEGA